MPDRFRLLARHVGRALNGHGAVRFAKNLRNALVDAGFRRCARSAGKRFAAELAKARVRQPVVTIAFNSPWVIDLLTSAWLRHQPDVPLVVVDNSSDEGARKEHDNLCWRRGVPYLALPRNPEWSPNRSHGIALNWFWFNVVLHGDFDFVGFIDHDCIPIAEFDIGGQMRDRDAYGMKGQSLTYPEAWNLWAGYCFLRPVATAGRTVDFKHRIEYGLDTGGGNWPGVYRRLAPERVGAADSQWVRIDVNARGGGGNFLLIDRAFLHLDGVSYKPLFREPGRRRELALAILQEASSSTKRPVGPLHGVDDLQ